MTHKNIRYISLILILNLFFNLNSKAQTGIVDSTTVSDKVNIAYGEQPSWTTSSSITTINGQEISKSFDLNTGNRLSGRLPGLTVMPNSYEPGIGKPDLYIRGLNTFGTGRSVLVMVDGIESSYENLVPEEIETISVLKDASALAIYGSRGANGVLLITTKKGHEGPLKISFGIQQGLSSALRMPDFLESYDFATLYNEALANDGIAPKYSASDLAAYRDGSDKFFHPNVDWYGEVLRKSASISNYNLNFTGGNSSAKYFVLLNVASNNGLYKRTTDQSYFRFNLRSNIDINVTKDFNFKFLLGAQSQQKSNPKSNDTRSMFSLLSQIPPNSFPVYNPNGTFGANSIYSNPLGDALMTGSYTSDTRSVLLKGVATQNLDFVTKGLSASATFAFNTSFSSISNKVRDYERFSISGDINNIVYNQYGQDESLSAYENADNHGNNLEWQFDLNYNRSMGSSDIDAKLMYSEFTATIPGNAIPYKNNALRGRFTYALNKTYIGEMTFAYNGTENFPKGSRWGLFPAISVGWIASNEDFMSENSVVNYLKFRGSYGLTGNDNIGGTRFMFNPQAYTGVRNYYFGTDNSAQGSIAEGQIRNGNVTWEKEKKLSVGLEATLFKQLFVTLDIFNNNRNDILAKPTKTIPSFFGFGNLPDYNLGKTNNRGYEATITYESNHSKDFGYCISTSLWYAKNKIVYNAEEIRQYDYLKRTGLPIDQPFSLVSQGFFKDNADINSSPRQIFQEVKPGDIKYVDQNGDGIIDQNDIFPVGFSGLPQISGCLEISVNYKKFDLNVFLHGVTSRSVFYSGHTYQAFQGNGKISTMALGRWTPDTKETATYPRLTASDNFNNFQSSTFWMRDGSFVKLRNIEIGYNFQEIIIGKINIEGIRLFLNGTNLLSWDHMDFTDPEIQTGYPAMQTYSVGARVQF